MSKTGILTPTSLFLLGIGTVFKNSNNDGPSYQLQTPGSTLPEIFYPLKASQGINYILPNPQTFNNQGYN